VLLESAEAGQKKASLAIVVCARIDATLSTHCNALELSDGWCVVDISGAHVSDILVWLKQLSMQPQVLNGRDKTQ